MRLVPFFAGAAATVVILALVGVGFLEHARGFSAREKPGALESWVAEQANPVADSPQVLSEAMAHWADHCAVCHANNGSGDAQMGKQMYPPAPDMRQNGTQKMTDGELFFIIENGVRFTGMPAWGGSARSEEDSWKLVRFIRHLPQLTREEESRMEALNPKSPDELQEEQEERDFLNGAEKDEHLEQHHHH
jgi:mono/diheme cytochrome c family protein